MNPSAAPVFPLLSLHNHQQFAEVDLPLIEGLLDQALPLILASPGAAPSCLTGVEEVELSLIDDSEIARIHGEFMDDPTATDVITFQHGEILASVETAAREAAARDDLMPRELTLYLIHGLLHLHGHTDAEPAPRALMHAAQDRILATVWPLTSAASSPDTTSA